MEKASSGRPAPRLLSCLLCLVLACQICCLTACASFGASAPKGAPAAETAPEGVSAETVPEGAPAAETALEGAPAAETAPERVSAKTAPEGASTIETAPEGISAETVPEEVPAAETVLEGASTTETVPQESSVREPARKVEELLSQMSLDEKISQMIIVAIRTWDGKEVTDLSGEPELAKALREHQYGGVILFGTNIVSTEQTVRLLSDLQKNNGLRKKTSIHIPYFTPVDQEGGAVVRLNSGTRMTGNMAIGATGEKAAENAQKTGSVMGEELAALGFNVNFAPVVDVNSEPSNPVIGTRSFSDDPAVVASLGEAFARGLAKEGIIACFKHFPGHGNTVTDSHIGTASVEKDLEELSRTDLVPFTGAVRNGAEMIMTAHITYPQIDEEVVFGDGVTKGFYPATMSKKMITGLLREELGFDGVVVTDALEMDAIRTAALVPGEAGSTRYRVNIAEKVINAGSDILLIPADLSDKKAAAFYDDYIKGLGKKVKDGTIPGERIDESVRRILQLKEKYGILDMDTSGKDVENAVINAKAVTGSAAHHDMEMEIARQAVTLIKNEGNILPLDGNAPRIVILGREEEDILTIEYALDRLRKQGLLSPDAEITADYYYNPDAEEEKDRLHYTKEMKKAIRKADAVIAISKSYGISALEKGAPQYTGLHKALRDTRKGGGRFILLIDNLPYDAARYQESDAILQAYMGDGLDMDPTSRDEDSDTRMAYNANVVAAIEAIFGAYAPTGRLPVNIPVFLQEKDGSLHFGSELLYERGFGLTY